MANLRLAILRLTILRLAILRLAILCLALLLGASNAAAQGSVVGEEQILVVSQDLKRPLASGEKHAYRFDLGAGVWKLTARQLGVDVELTWIRRDGERITVDSPLDRVGAETLLIRLQEPGSDRIEVHGRERSAPSGQYQLRLEPFGASIAELNGAEPGTPSWQRRIVAESARMAASRLYATGPSGRSGAIAQYRTAVEAWRELGAEQEEARDLYAIAVLQRLSGEGGAALETATETLHLWRRLARKPSQEGKFWQAATLNEMGLNQWDLDRVDEARELFERALPLLHEVGNKVWEVKTLNNLCLTFLSRGELQAGLDCYAPLMGRLAGDDPLLAATVHTNAGWASDALGEPDSALDHYEKALALARQAGDRTSEAQILNNLGKVFRGLGELEGALERYGEALDIFRRLEDLRWQARVLSNIGSSYTSAGEPRRALAFLRESLELRRRTKQRRGEIFTLNNLALAERSLLARAEALGTRREALALAEELEDPRLEGITRLLLADDFLEFEDGAAASRAADEALALLRSAKDRPREAEALSVAGQARLQLGDHAGAVVLLEHALELRLGFKDLAGSVETRMALARVARAEGKWAAAMDFVEEAQRDIELLRRGFGATGLRSTFFGLHGEAFELQIDGLMTRHAEQPGEGFDRRAFEVSERARARTLLDRLAEGGHAREEFTRNDGGVGELLERRRTLGRSLNAKARRRTTLLASQPEGWEAEVLDREVASLLHQLDRVESEIRRSSPRLSALSRPILLAAAEIQELLEDSVLLHYALGEERSFLFWVTADEFKAIELPSRREIEDSARRLHGLLNSPGVEDRRRQAREARVLSDLVLAPVADRLDDRRLVIVADGALHYVPFAALPEPGNGLGQASAPAPLIERREVVHLPSGSALASLRRRLPLDAISGRLAIIADPVMDRKDPRFDANARQEPAAAGGPVTRGQSSAPQPSADFARLLGSHREAAEISALVPEEHRLVALGFDANRDTVFGSDFGRHQVVHFATHGVIDTQTPRLSGLLLSSLDSEGEPRDGFLRLHELYGLRLGAELVVLSGCETALGQEIRGEGLVGLTQAFMHAGAGRVLASLWRVEDRATAALMTRFYRALWLEGHAPPAALREAQLSIRRQGRWQDPYYWSGFVLQGEWRPMSAFSQSSD